MPKKSLGQHFLRCRWVVSALLKAAEVKPEDVVLEIGSGTGVLTRALAREVKKVITVEKDEKLAEELADSLEKEGVGNIKILTGDILNMFDWLGLTLDISKTKPRTKKYKIVANIPYYLTSRLLRSVLEHKIKPQIIVLTIQKEVAQRIIARPSKMNPVRGKTPETSAVPRVRASNGMNLLALSVQAFGRPEIIKIVPASCFWPRPKVDSAIIKITGISDDFFRENGLDAEQFFQIARAAFGQKRKLLTNTLTKIAPKEEIEKALKEAGVNPKARPEELSLEQWTKIVLGITKTRS